MQFIGLKSTSGLYSIIIFLNYSKLNDHFAVGHLYVLIL